MTDITPVVTLVQQPPIFAPCVTGFTLTENYRHSSRSSKT